MDGTIQSSEESSKESSKEASSQEWLNVDDLNAAASNQGIIFARKTVQRLVEAHYHRQGGVDSDVIRYGVGKFVKRNEKGYRVAAVYLDVVIAELRRRFENELVKRQKVEETKAAELAAKIAAKKEAKEARRAKAAHGSGSQKNEPTSSVPGSYSDLEESSSDETDNVSHSGIEFTRDLNSILALPDGEISEEEFQRLIGGKSHSTPSTPKHTVEVSSEDLTTETKHDKTTNTAKEIDRENQIDTEISKKVVVEPNEVEESVKRESVKRESVKRESFPLSQEANKVEERLTSSPMVRESTAVTPSVPSREGHGAIKTSGNTKEAPEFEEKSFYKTAAGPAQPSVRTLTLVRELAPKEAYEEGAKEVLKEAVKPTKTVRPNPSLDVKSSKKSFLDRVLGVVERSIDKHELIRLSPLPLSISPSAFKASILKRFHAASYELISSIHSFFETPVRLLCGLVFFIVSLVFLAVSGLMEVDEREDLRSSNSHSFREALSITWRAWKFFIKPIEDGSIFPLFSIVLICLTLTVQGTKLIDVIDFQFVVSRSSLFSLSYISMGFYVSWRVGRALLTGRFCYIGEGFFSHFGPGSVSDEVRLRSDSNHYGQNLIEKEDECRLDYEFEMDAMAAFNSMGYKVFINCAQGRPDGAFRDHTRARVDLLLRLPDGSEYAIDCRRSGDKLGVSEVRAFIQEVAMSGYSYLTPAIVTFQGYTDDALRLAEDNGVRLWTLRQLVLNKGCRV